MAVQALCPAMLPSNGKAGRGMVKDRNIFKARCDVTVLTDLPTEDAPRVGVGMAGYAASDLNRSKRSFVLMAVFAGCLFVFSRQGKPSLRIMFEEHRRPFLGPFGFDVALIALTQIRFSGFTVVFPMTISTV